MTLYLHTNLFGWHPTDEELAKSEGPPKQKAGASKPVDASSKGEQRGGTYVARVQNGYEKDGSPKYRYFRTETEYESYLHNKGKSPQAKNLEDKVKKEHEDSKEKATGHVNPSEDKEKKRHGLLTKSVRLYVKG